MEAWLGFGATQSYYGTWVGGVVALNPQHNVWDSGFVLRGEATIGRYTVDDNPFQDSVLTHGASWMFGYRQKVGDGLLTGYIGANYENHDNDLKTEQIRGLEVGFRALVEYYTRITPTWDFYGQGSYSTAFDVAFLFARSGFQLSETVWLGPEARLLPERVRLCRKPPGRILRFEQVFFGSGVTLSGGWVNALRKQDEDGWYAALNIDFQVSAIRSCRLRAGFPAPSHLLLKVPAIETAPGRARTVNVTPYVGWTFCGVRCMTARGVVDSTAPRRSSCRTSG